MDSFQFRASKVEKLYKLLQFFRAMEISLILIFIWRNAAQFPARWDSGREYFYEVLMILSGPRTVFVIGNVIVLILFAKSRQSLSSSSHDVSEPDPDHDIIDDGGVVHGSQKLKSCRSKSDTWRKMVRKGEVRRSVTGGGEERCRKQLIWSGEDAGEEGKGMSDEEFRDMVEAFIARQLRNRREESAYK